MKSYEEQPTSNPDLFRVVDREGEWSHYLHKPSGAYLRGATSILSRAYPKGEGFKLWQLRHTEAEANDILRAAGDRGDALHQAFSLILSGIPFDRHTQVLAENNRDHRGLTNDEWDAVLSFEAFWNAHAPKLIAHEQAVYSLPDGYAGTFDVIFRITKDCGSRSCNCAPFVGLPVLADWKTGGGIYDSYGPQVACYAVAIATMAKSPLFNLTLGGTAIIRLGTSHKNGGFEGEFYNLAETGRHWKEFLAAKELDDATYRPFDPAKEIYDIPETLSITVEREDLSPAPVKKSRPKKPSAPKKRASKRKVAKPIQQAS